MRYICDMHFMPRLMALPTLIFLSACAPAAAPDPQIAAPVAVERVRFTISSWGQPQRAWTLEADGSLLVETKADGQPFHSYDLDQRRTTLSAEDAAAVRAALAPARRPLPSCTVMLTDGPSMFIHWTGATEQNVSVYFGCREQAFRPVIESAMSADARVGEAVANVPISGKRHIGP